MGVLVSLPTHGAGLLGEPLPTGESANLALLLIVPFTDIANKRQSVRAILHLCDLPWLFLSDQLDPGRRGDGLRGAAPDSCGRREAPERTNGETKSRAESITRGGGKDRTSKVQEAECEHADPVRKKLPAIGETSSFFVLFGKSIFSRELVRVHI